jgi:hypothetical protein
MKRPVLEAGLAVLTLTLTAAAVRRAAGTELLNAPVPVPPAAHKAAPYPSAAALDRARTNLIEENPFRINRLPGLVRVGQPLEQTVASVSPARIAIPRPQLTVRAIVGGPPWSALVEGLPNTSGSVVVRTGEAFDWITIGDITRDTLVAAARDTAWKYSVHREP